MNRTEIPLEEFTKPEDWKKENDRIYPPAEGRALERAVKGMNRLENIRWPWPNIIDPSRIPDMQAYLSALGNEFMSNVLEEHPNASLDVGFKRHQQLLRDIKGDINEAARDAPQLVYFMTPDNEEDVRQAMLSAVREKNEKDAAVNEATRIIMRKANPPSKNVTFIRDADRHNTERLTHEGHILLNTAQDFLTFETFADRKGHGEMPNVWETLIDMYILGMESFDIDPSTGQLRVSVLFSNGNNVERHIFVVPKI